MESRAVISENAARKELEIKLIKKSLTLYARVIRYAGSAGKEASQSGRNGKQYSGRPE